MEARLLFHPQQQAVSFGWPGVEIEVYSGVQGTFFNPPPPTRHNMSLGGGDGCDANVDVDCGGWVKPPT